MTDSAARLANDFIRQIIRRDLAQGKNEGRVITRFPPEPNGFLHIGHAKSIVLNFGIAREFAAADGVRETRCHLRFDDTNPSTEDLRYVEAIQEDVQWLGHDWGEHLYFASDYFEEMYSFAQELIRKGLAYVDSQSEKEIRERRGTVTEPGIPSPHRGRSVEANLDLFRRMRAGEFAEGEHVLRAKIDMASPNMLMRDPLLYRIRHVEHYRTGDEWCIYPLYDFAHPLGDALEGITHSLCTLEFENNREVYDWLVENTSVPYRPHQYEFARLNLDFTIMSKRKLLRLVKEGDVEGWDDPRMPTIAGLRRRGITPQAIRTFCEMIGVARSDSRVDMGKLEYAVRDDLNQKAPRVLCVLDPLKVVITDWPQGKTDELEAPHYPHDVPLEGSRILPFSRELYIDRDDFAEDPPKGFRRLVLGGEVRLRYGYIIRCQEVVKDAQGRITELRCTHDPGSRGGSAPDGRKVKGTIHWVSAAHALPCRVRLYDRLFTVPDPDAAAAGRGEDGDIRDFLNPESLEVKERALVEPSVADDPPDTRYQFERVGYFWRDPVESEGDALVFNRIETLRDTWAKVGTKLAAGGVEREGRDAPARRKGRDGSEDGAAAEPHAGEPGAPPELPPEVKARATELESQFQLERVDAEILARDAEVERFFRVAVEEWPDGALPLANWIINELPPLQGDRPLEALPFGPGELAELVELVEEGTISSSGGRQALEVLARDGGEPGAIVERLDLAQISDPTVLRPIVLDVVEAHPDKVKAYMTGKKGLMGFFMGQVMRETRGKANPEVAKGLLSEVLDG